MTKSHVAEIRIYMLDIISSDSRLFSHSVFYFHLLFDFFFFQAEDGIRDKLVTGVQTCALPILTDQLQGVVILDGDNRELGVRFDRPVEIAHLPIDQIGRASCRERV